MNWKILIAVLGLLFLSGCSGFYIDDGVVRTESGESIVSESKNAIYTMSALFEIAEGKVPAYYKVHKFGAGVLTTTMAPITQSGFYRTPSSAVALEFLSDDVDDTFGGAGAQQITIIGLNSSWQEITQVINTNGTTPVTIPINMTRVYRWYVSSSGTYASQTAGSHQGNLEIREAGGGQVWTQIPNAPFPSGQSEIGVFTIPANETGYLLSKMISTDTTKTADIFFFKRCGADDTVTPYEGTMTLIERDIGLTGLNVIQYQIPKGRFDGACDVGFMGSVSSGTADVSIEFELIIDKED